MDDIFVNSLPSWNIYAIIAVCILFIIGIVFTGSIIALRQSKLVSYWFRWAKSGDERWRNGDANLS